MTYYAQMPLIVPHFIALGQTMYEKSVKNFYTLQYFDVPVRPLVQSSPTLALVYSKAPSINLPNFVDFVDGVNGTKNSK